MSPRRRQWLAVLITASLVVSMLIGWGGYLRARATPHYVQTAPGASATPGHENSTSMRLASLTVTQGLVTDRTVDYAPPGALWVIAVVDYVPPPEGASCFLNLLATDGRTWTSRSSLDYRGSRVLPASCSAEPGQSGQVELIYQIPEDAASHLAGLVTGGLAYRGTDPYWVLTPPR